MRLFIDVCFFLAIFSELNFVYTQEDVFQDVNIRYYYGDKNTVYKEYYLNATKKLTTHPKFQKNRVTILYTHGWNQIVDEDKTLSHVVDSYLQRNDHNILILNYEKLAAKFYPTVVENVPELGKKVAITLMDLFKIGLDYTRIHLVGFSLGAHISAEISRTMQRVGYNISRITGLDPAYPLYYSTGDNKELTKTDAKFVDIIHTDAGIFGGNESTGHADFYPNGGSRPQPMCGNSFWQFASLIVGDHCAHDAAVHLYAESVTEKNLFLATNRQNSSITVRMGFHCPLTAAGDYDLKTK